jgi:hypothetical protein
MSKTMTQTHEQCPPELKKHLYQISEVIADLKGWNIDGPPEDVARPWPQWVSNRSRRGNEDSL